MKINKINLQNFRNFEHSSFSFDNVSVLLANNGKGKTNVLEAIYYLVLGKSFRADSDKDLYQFEKDFFSIEGVVENENQGLVKLRVFDSLSSRKAYQVNGVNKSFGNFNGILRGVVFTPENFDILQGSPDVRRKFFDSIFEQIDREYSKNLILYRRVLFQRNRLLERICEKKSKVNELEYWNNQLVELGMLIQQKRYQLTTFFNDLIGNYSVLLYKKERLRIEYLEKSINEKKLLEVLEKELLLGMTLVGPHRDDFLITLDGKKISNFGSRGEQRLAILSLVLLSLDYIEFFIKERPILLLDDIFSELDDKHSHYVLDILEKQQTIITSTFWNDSFKKNVKKILL